MPGASLQRPALLLALPDLVFTPEAVTPQVSQPAYAFCRESQFPSPKTGPYLSSSLGSHRKRTELIETQHKTTAASALGEALSEAIFNSEPKILVNSIPSWTAGQDLL